MNPSLVDLKVDPLHVHLAILCPTLGVLANYLRQNSIGLFQVSPLVSASDVVFDLSAYLPSDGLFPL